MRLPSIISNYFIVGTEAKKFLRKNIESILSSPACLVIDYNERTDLLDFNLISNFIDPSPYYLIDYLDSVAIYLSEVGFQICIERKYKGVTVDHNTGRLTIVR